MSLGDRLMQLLHDKGWSAAELARRANVPQPTVHRIGGGATTNPKRETVDKIARALGVKEEWLWTGKGDPHPKPGDTLLSSIDLWDDSTPIEDDEVAVPFLKEVELAAGSGRFAIEENETSTLRFGKRSLRNNGVKFDQAKCVTVRGNSMEPVLRDGATIGINIGRSGIGDIVDGEMYAIDHGGQLRVKQLYRTPTGIRFRSFNRDEHPDEEYDFKQMLDQGISILGHVFWWGMFAKR